MMGRYHQCRWMFARHCTQTRTYLWLIAVCCCVISTAAALMIIHYWHSEMVHQLAVGRCTTHDCIQDKLCCCEFDFFVDVNQPRRNRSLAPFTTRMCQNSAYGCNQGIWREQSHFGCWATVDKIIWFQYPNPSVLQLLAVLGNIAFWFIAMLMCCQWTDAARVADLPDYLWRDAPVRVDKYHVDEQKLLYSDDDDDDDLTRHVSHHNFTFFGPSDDQDLLLNGQSKHDHVAVPTLENLVGAIVGMRPSELASSVATSYDDNMLDQQNKDEQH